MSVRPLFSPQIPVSKSITDGLPASGRLDDNDERLRTIRADFFNRENEKQANHPEIATRFERTGGTPFATTGLIPMAEPFPLIEAATHPGERVAAHPRDGAFRRKRNN
jgi:hypothetical protein